MPTRATANMYQILNYMNAFPNKPMTNEMLGDVEQYDPGWWYGPLWVHPNVLKSLVGRGWVTVTEKQGYKFPKTTPQGKRELVRLSDTSPSFRRNAPLV